MERLEEFDILQNFKFLEAHETMADCSDGTKASVLIMKFVNDKNVAIDVTIIDGEWHIEEPYAVTDEYLPLKSREEKV